MGSPIRFYGYSPLHAERPEGLPQHGIREGESIDYGSISPLWPGLQAPSLWGDDASGVHFHSLDSPRFSTPAALVTNSPPGLPKLARQRPVQQILASSSLVTSSSSPWQSSDRPISPSSADKNAKFRLCRVCRQTISAGGPYFAQHLRKCDPLADPKNEPFIPAADIGTSRGDLLQVAVNHQSSSQASAEHDSRLIGTSASLATLSRRSQYGFTTSQRIQLANQLLIARYLAARQPLPSQLVQAFLKDLQRSPSEGYLGPIARRQAAGQCRRTDGKSWCCSRDAVVGEKYCERHLHRGRQLKMDLNNSALSKPYSPLADWNSASPPSLMSQGTSERALPPFSRAANIDLRGHGHSQLWESGTQAGVKPEPSSDATIPEGWCRRTDGRRWTCLQPCAPGQRYCSKHAAQRGKRTREGLDEDVETPYEVLGTSSTSASWQLASRSAMEEPLPAAVLKQAFAAPASRQPVQKGAVLARDQSLPATQAGVDTQCRRTDGRSWRCSKEVVPGQKFCEKHVRRSVLTGGNRQAAPSPVRERLAVGALEVLQEVGRNKQLIHRERRAGEKREFPEGQCHRTDGKSWVCSRPVAVEGGKYCSKHVHRPRSSAGGRGSLQKVPPNPFEGKKGLEEPRSPLDFADSEFELLEKVKADPQAEGEGEEVDFEDCFNWAIGDDDTGDARPENEQILDAEVAPHQPVGACSSKQAGPGLASSLARLHGGEAGHWEQRSMGPSVLKPKAGAFEVPIAKQEGTREAFEEQTNSKDEGERLTTSRRLRGGGASRQSLLDMECDAHNGRALSLCSQPVKGVKEEGVVKGFDPLWEPQREHLAANSVDHMGGDSCNHAMALHLEADKKADAAAQRPEDVDNADEWWGSTLGVKSANFSSKRAVAFY